MNPRTAAEVALGVAAVWLIASRIPELVISLAFFPAGEQGLLRWLGVVQAGVVVLCGLGLAHLRGRIASWLVPMEQPDLKGSTAGFQAAAFAVIGVILVADGLTDIFHEMALSSRNGVSLSFQQSAMAGAQMAVGLILFLGARGLVAVWHSLRVAGRPRQEGDDGDAA